MGEGDRKERKEGPGPLGLPPYTFPWRHHPRPSGSLPNCSLTWHRLHSPMELPEEGKLPETHSHIQQEPPHPSSLCYFGSPPNWRTERPSASRPSSPAKSWALLPPPSTSQGSMSPGQAAGSVPALDPNTGQCGPHLESWIWVLEHQSSITEPWGARPGPRLALSLFPVRGLPGLVWPGLGARGQTGCFCWGWFST